MNGQQYCVFLFPSVSYVLKAEKILKDREIDPKRVPVPRHISADCGVCLPIGVECRKSGWNAAGGNRLGKHGAAVDSR